MRIEWQVVALSVMVMAGGAGGACVPAGSKTSDDTIDDGSGGGSTDTSANGGGGGTDTEVTVEECYPGNLSREVSECLIEAGADGYLGIDGWDQDRYYEALNYGNCSTGELRDFRVGLEMWHDAWDEQAACWDACADGEACAEYYRTSASCGRDHTACWAAALERYDCDVLNDDYEAAYERCGNALEACLQPVDGMGVGCTF